MILWGDLHNIFTLPENIWVRNEYVFFSHKPLAPLREADGMTELTV
jgi:hypothetical protein